MAVRIAWPSVFESESLNNYSLEVNIAPENIPSQKESRLPAIIFLEKNLVVSTLMFFQPYLGDS